MSSIFCYATFGTFKKFIRKLFKVSKWSTVLIAYKKTNFI